MDPRTTSWSRLLTIAEELRDPERGCAWDRAQDHQSLRPFALEEAHELVEAIDAEDDARLMDELGDLLLQVVLHSLIASERDAFDIADVAETIADKLVRRHPHVFADAPNDLPSIHRKWHEIKAEERTQTGGSLGAPASAPTLVRARKKLSAMATQGMRVEDAANGESASPEERAGLEILSLFSSTLAQGLDPEIAILKALRRLEAGSSGIQTQ